MPKALRRKGKLLDQQLVTEFAEYRALKNKIEKWVKVLSEDFLAKFEAGFACPTDGPFLLERGGGKRKNIDWEQEFFERLKSDFKSSGSADDVAEQLAIVKMGEMERLAGKTPYYQVNVKVNPSFAGEVVRAIVKKLDSRKARGF
jgi:hypothetical protein